MIQEKLEIEDVNIERAHRVGNTSNTSPRTVVDNFYSFKGKQLVLSAAKTLKGQNISTKTSLRIRWILGKRNGSQ